MIDNPWAYTVNHVGDVSTVAVSGEFDFTAREELHDVLMAEVNRPGVRRVEVDLAEVGFLDSAGISALVAGYLAAQDIGRKLTVVRAHGRARHVLELTGVMALLDENAQSALEDGR